MAEAAAGAGARGAPYRLKRSGGFFAAGEEFRAALGRLGDGAFKVYAWACLHADRASGELRFGRADLARSLGRSPSSLGRHLRQLEAAGVCELGRARNQHGGSLLRVRARYWPYRPAGGDAEPEPEPGSAAAYLAAVRRALREPSCVQVAFGPADERLARGWHREGVPLEAVRRAILLGSVRRSITMINWRSRQPIASLRYFEKILREVLAGDWPPGYWKHLELHLQRCEQHWREHPERTPGGAPARPA